MGAKFRTCLFGGFNKDDVVSFIKKLAQESQAKKEEIEGLSAQLETLKTQLSDYESGGETLASLSERLRQAEERAEAAEREAQELRGPAEEYQQMKDHIAEIEISAHKRTEEFRAQAMERLRNIIAQQRQWCYDQRDIYGAMNNGLIERLGDLQRQVEQSDYSAFDRMQDLLNDMENELHD